jgi:hypothetical protein
MVVIGVVLVGVGIYATVASQSEINYVKSCERPVACGTTANPTPTSRTFLNASLTTSLQEGELGSLAGIALVVLGLGGISYGVFLVLTRPELAS